ncbi:ATP-binding cassette domain-containing protein [Candidatus Uhrbacteria bacterium]|nr:ATP-binding cassette domain-containing protein [Candidatus Uhrbacteria bacterium]
MIHVENLTKSFKDVHAVRDLSFDIQQGEIVGLLGPNGAGKTTTMRLMTGFLAPDAGSVSIDGMLVTEQAANIQKHIGYLPENNPLYKEMLVSELLKFSADTKQIPKKDQHAAYDFVVSSVGIGDVFYRKIGELSKGYKQRVGLAVALLHQPKILILDEPTEGLDPNQRTDIRSLIKNLAKDRTIMVSTHVLQEASALCARMLIINKGKLIADGTPEGLSRTLRRGHCLFGEFEGAGIEYALRSLAHIEDIQIEKTEQGRIRARITSKESIELQPDISRLAREHQWIIWKLGEEEKSLEDIFHVLTSINIS